jgi:hypothetical protein
VCYCVSFYLLQRLKNASNANLKKHYHKINKSAGDFSSAIRQISDDFIARHTEVIVEEVVHAMGAGTATAADLVKGQRCKVGQVGFCKKGCNEGELVCHIDVV